MSVKPYAIATGIAGLLFLGDKCNAGSFVGETGESFTAYSGDSFNPKLLLRRAFQKNPKGLEKTVEEFHKAFVKTSEEYASEIMAGEYDDNLTAMEKSLYQTLDAIKEARSDEANLKSLDQKCKPGDVTAFLQLYGSSLVDIADARPRDIDFMADSKAMEYITAARSTLTEDGKKAMLSEAAVEAVQGNYLSEDDAYTVFAGVMGSLPREKTFGTIVAYVPTARAEVQKQFAVQVVTQMQPDQEFQVLDQILSYAKDPLLGQVMTKGLSYSNQGTKDSVALQAVPLASSEAQREVLVDSGREVSKNVYDRVKNFFGGLMGSP